MQLPLSRNVCHSRHSFQFKVRCFINNHYFGNRPKKHQRTPVTLFYLRCIIHLIYFQQITHRYRLIHTAERDAGRRSTCRLRQQVRTCSSQGRIPIYIHIVQILIYYRHFVIIAFSFINSLNDQICTISLGIGFIDINRTVFGTLFIGYRFC